jgi:hypothetical protein
MNGIREAHGRVGSPNIPKIQAMKSRATESGAQAVKVRLLQKSLQKPTPFINPKTDFEEDRLVREG